MAMVISLFHAPCVMADLNNRTSNYKSYGIEDLSFNLSYRDVLRSIVDLTECKINSARSQDFRKLAD